MATVHFLNVGKGDCSIIEHDSGRVSVIDICNGNASSEEARGKVLAQLPRAKREARADIVKTARGNFGMNSSPTDPIAYLKGLEVSSVFRFILTHPDMDHLDGFKRLCDEMGIVNFWDSGVRKKKPDFPAGGYEQRDWEQYEKVVDGQTEVHVLKPLQGDQFQYANKGDPNGNGDFLYIVSPNEDLVRRAIESGDVNDASYVIVFRTPGGKIIFPGDAHDKTWQYVLKDHKGLVTGCAVLIAPHHGRESNRSYDFLDTLEPKLTLFGCAKSEHLAYEAWNSRKLLFITNNQAGNVILRAVSSGIDVYVENKSFAEKFSTFDATRRYNGCYYVGQAGRLEYKDE